MYTLVLVQNLGTIFHQIKSRYNGKGGEPQKPFPRRAYENYTWFGIFFLRMINHTYRLITNYYN